MGLNRYAKRRDANEGDIVKALKAIGCTVEKSDGIDLIVGFRGRNWLMEVKDGPKKKLKPKQIALRATWAGQYAVVTSVDDALKLITEG